MENLDQGLVIVAVGIGGVFVNLLALMFVVIGIGKLFGKKKKKKKEPKKEPAPSPA